MSHLPALTRQLLAAGLSDALPTFATRGAVTAMQFNVMKVLPAFSTIAAARMHGRLRPGQSVIESSSGSFAYGLARVCSSLGHPLTIVSADLEAWLHEALERLGTRVELIDAGGDLKRVQRLRLERLEELRQRDGAFWPCQYHNADNPRGYVPAAELLVAHMGVPDILVCPVGSGGNSAGLIQVLRAIRPSVKLVGVDCPGSVTFGAPLADRELGGIGNSLIPRCVAHREFDEVHWVGSSIAVAGARRIAVDGMGDFGLTSGAAYTVACEVASRHPGAAVAAVFPDRAYRYVDLLAASGELDSAALAPAEIQHPGFVAAPWTRLRWDRRSLSSWLRARELNVAAVPT